MNNIVSNKIPTIFDFLLEVESIEDCMRYFNETISQENKEKIKQKNFQYSTKKFLNFSRPFFNEKSKPTKVLGDLNLPNFHNGIQKTLSKELKNVKISNLVHKKMFELTKQNIIDLFRSFVLRLFIKCFLPFTYSEDSYFLLYNDIELNKYIKYCRNIIDYKHISISNGLNQIVNLIIDIDNHNHTFSESDNFLIKRFKEYLGEIKNKDLSKLYTYLTYVFNDENNINFDNTFLNVIINNIINYSFRTIQRRNIDYNKIIQFFFILFLIDNFNLFVNLREHFINIQKECKFNALYILYYKLKYIEEQLSSTNAQAQARQFYTSVYDYLVYKLYLDIQLIVEPQIVHIIDSFELKYTFVDELIQQQLVAEQEVSFHERQPKENNKRRTKPQLEEPNNQNLSQENNNNTIDINLHKTSLNDLINILNGKLDKIKKNMINKKIYKLNNKMSSKIKHIEDMYSLFVLLKNEYQNEYKDKDKLLKKILRQLKKRYPDLRNNNINSVNEISKLFNKPQRNVLKLQKVFNYLIDVFHITNEDIIQSIRSNNPSHNDEPPPYSNVNVHNILGYRPITS